MEIFSLECVIRKANEKNVEEGECSGSSSSVGVLFASIDNFEVRKGEWALPLNIFSVKHSKV